MQQVQRILQSIHWVAPSEDGKPPPNISEELRSFFQIELGIEVSSLSLERGKIIINNNTEILVSESLFEYIKLALV